MLRMLTLTYILRMNDFGLVPLTDRSLINYIDMHDASRDDNCNTCFGCWLWPIFYAWMILGQSHLLKNPSSTLLTCMMHLGMTTEMHASDADFDLYFMHEWFRAIPLADRFHINFIDMHDASRDDKCNECFRCWLWPIFYAWMILVISAYWQVPHQQYWYAWCI